MMALKRSLWLMLITACLSGCSQPTPHAGEQVWLANCKVCHQPGLAGAPKFGDVQAWKKRLARGMPSLYGHALEGWGDMPARGGNPSLSDEEVKQAVDYMVLHSQ